MSLHFEGEIDFGSEIFQKFLITEDTQFRFNPEAPNDFSFDDTHIRTDTAVDDRQFESFDNPTKFDYLVRHVYPLIQMKKNAAGVDIVVQLGEISAQTLNQVELEVTAEFQLHMSGFLTADTELRNEAIRLFNEYTFQPSPDFDEDFIEQWITAQSQGRIGHNDYKVLVAHVVNVRSRTEIDRKQLDLLQNMYSGGDSSQATIYMPPYNADISKPLDDYFTEAGIILGNGRLEIDLGIENDASSDAIDSDGTNTEGVIQDAIDNIINNVIPIDACERNNLLIEQNLLLRMPKYPEFKIVWKNKRIKIGCSRISIKLPELHIKETEKSFYTYFSYPKDLYKAAITICFKCAERGAISGTVIGLITWNLAAGIAEFKRMFLKCVDEETQKCISAGILEVNETKGWKKKASI